MRPMQRLRLKTDADGDVVDADEAESNVQCLMPLWFDAKADLNPEVEALGLRLTLTRNQRLTSR